MARKTNNEEKAKIVDNEEIISFDTNGIKTEEREEVKLDEKDLEIIKLSDEISMLKSQSLRLAADFENFKRRNQDVASKSYVDGGVDIILGILPVLDSFDRAISMLGENDDNGVVMIKKQMDKALSDLKVEEIEALNKEFDPKFHNAVMQCEDSDNAGKVVEVFQKGYIYKGKIVRHSMVKVAK